MNEAPHLLIEVDGPLLILTLNRPGARNAFSLEMLGRLAEAWDEADSREEIRVILLTGAGGTFCSGADLKLMHGDLSHDPWHARFRANPGLHWKALLRSHRPRKPLIAAVEGFAFGGGMEILQGTDIRIAAEDATFAVSEVKWGLFPLGGSTVRLRRQIPPACAMELLMTGRSFTAAEGEKWGFLSRVVPKGEALSEAKKMASLIAANGPLAVQAIKRSALESDGLPEEEALERELAIGQPVFSTEDAREGPRAFAEKRKADFKGR